MIGESPWREAANGGQLQGALWSQQVGPPDPAPTHPRIPYAVTVDCVVTATGSDYWLTGSNNSLTTIEEAKGREFSQSLSSEVERVGGVGTGGREALPLAAITPRAPMAPL